MVLWLFDSLFDNLIAVASIYWQGTALRSPQILANLIYTILSVGGGGRWDSKSTDSLSILANSLHLMSSEVHNLSTVSGFKTEALHY